MGPKVLVFRELPMLGVVYLVLVAIQFGMQPHLYRYIFRDRKQYHAVVVIALMETFKFFVALQSLLLSSSGSLVLNKWRWRESLMLCGPPATMYAVQDWLVDYANRPSSLCPPLIFQLVNQTKVLWAAMFARLILGGRRSWAQWGALVVLAGAAGALAINPINSGDDLSQSQLVTSGVIATVVCAFLSGANQAMTERLVRSVGRDSDLYTMELAAYKIIFVLGVTFVSGTHATILREGVLVGLDGAACIPILIQGMGGIWIGKVVFLCGGDWKGYAILCGVVLSGVFGWLLDTRDFESRTIVGGVLVVLSMYVYNSYPLVEVSTDTKERKEN